MEHLDPASVQFLGQSKPIIDSWNTQGKLKRREYPTMTPLESDLRRMVGNAKSFNEKSSEIFSDAEKIRKALVSFMTLKNPAYKNKSYVPAPTPVPNGWQDRLGKQKALPDADGEGETDHEEPTKGIQEEHLKSRARVRSASANASNSRRETSTPAVHDIDGAGESFEGNNFQQAQEKIISEMINLKNDESVHSSLLRAYADFCL